MERGEAGERMTLEQYHHFFLDPCDAALSRSHLNQIIAMHGFMNLSHHGEFNLQPPRRSTLRCAAAAAAVMTAAEAEADVDALGWAEFPIGSLATFTSPVNATPVVPSPTPPPADFTVAGRRPGSKRKLASVNAFNAASEQPRPPPPRPPSPPTLLPPPPPPSPPTRPPSPLSSPPTLPPSPLSLPPTLPPPTPSSPPTTPAPPLPSPPSSPPTPPPPPPSLLLPPPPSSLLPPPRSSPPMPPPPPPSSMLPPPRSSPATPPPPPPPSPPTPPPPPPTPAAAAESPNLVLLPLIPYNWGWQPLIPYGGWQMFLMTPLRPQVLYWAPPGVPAPPPPHLAGQSRPPPAFPSPPY